MERIVGGIFIEAAMPSSCSHSCRQFLTIIQAFAHTESEKHSPPSVAKISARYILLKSMLNKLPTLTTPDQPAMNSISSRAGGSALTPKAKYKKAASVPAVGQPK